MAKTRTKRAVSRITRNRWAAASTVLPEGTNHLPTLEPPPPATAHPGQTITGGFAGNDPDGDTLTYTRVPGGPTGPVNVDSATGLVTYGQIPWADLGNQAIVVTVDDGNGGTATNSWSVTVQDQSPMFTTMMVPPATHHVSYQCFFNASDPEGDTLTWSLTDNTQAPGSSIDPNNGRFTWPDPTPQGQVTVTARVEEVQNSNAFAVRSFMIRVM